MQARRFSANPIITPTLDESTGANLNGPSLLRVPDWLPNPLGKYYLYFAHHQGAFIRLAYADELSGPWTIYPPGTLRLEQTPCYNHIASPDLHIDNDNRRILMYYHGPSVRREDLDADPLKQKYPFLEGQRSLLAVSENGLDFTSDSEILGPSYLRVFRYPDTAAGWYYALAMPGILFRSRNGRTNFEPGPVLFDRDQRHAALLLRDDILYVFYSRAGDCPSTSSAQPSICARTGKSGRPPPHSPSWSRIPTTRASTCPWNHRSAAPSMNLPASSAIPASTRKATMSISFTRSPERAASPLLNSISIDPSSRLLIQC